MKVQKGPCRESARDPASGVVGIYLLGVPEIVGRPCIGLRHWVALNHRLLPLAEFVAFSQFGTSRRPTFNQPD
jgi:hypothetical protein